MRNLQLLVSALSSSSDLLAAFNTNLADVTTVLSNTPNEVANATKGLDGGGERPTRLRRREPRRGWVSPSTGSSSITTALNDSRGDIKQVLHITPTVFQNFMNIYQPAQSAITGILAPINFADTVQFICSAIEAASRQGFEQVVQAVRAVPGADHQEPAVQLPAARDQPVRRSSARPNEITYSEDPTATRHLPPAAARGRPGRRARPAHRCLQKRRYPLRRHRRPRPVDCDARWLRRTDASRRGHP